VVAVGHVQPTKPIINGMVRTKIKAEIGTAASGGRAHNVNAVIAVEIVKIENRIVKGLEYTFISFSSLSTI
jgi:hypothetical protein